MNNLCLAEYYYKEYKENSCDETGDAQPEVLTDTATENQHNKTDADSLLPNKIKLMNTGESMKRQKVKAVIRVLTPNKRKEPELFFHHLSMLYYPWWDEGTLRGEEDTYASMFYEADVEAIIERN